MARSLVEAEEGVQVVNVLPRREFDQDDIMGIEFRIAEGHFLRMFNKGPNGRVNIQSIDIVKNKRLKAKFDRKKTELASKGCGQSLLLFHGTPSKNIESILINNFDIRKRANGRNYGDGVYFSERPEVSLAYSREKGRSGRTLLLCQVLMGSNLREVRKQEGSEDSEERCWAVVMPDVDQILPRYVIHLN